MRTFVGRTIAILLLIGIAVVLYRFPVTPWALAIGIAVYIVVLLTHPDLWLVVIPAVLPVFDLTPWSGRFFFDELDIFIFATLAIGLWRRAQWPAAPSFSMTSLSFILVILGVPRIVSDLIDLLPLQPWDANAFSNFYSHYNSLRLGKGFLEALSLYGLLLPSLSYEQACRRLSQGMVLGLTAAVVVVIWERCVFSGLFDFVSDFRVTATFSGLHNGGNDPEAYFVLAQPFVLAWAWHRRSVFTFIISIVLFIGSTYALLVTFSRGGYLGMSFSWIVLVLGLIRANREAFNFRVLLSLLICFAAAAAVAVPVLGGSYMRARFASIAEDWDYRVRQSLSSIDSMDNDWMTGVFGMGLGRFPEIFDQRKPLPIVPAGYRFLQNDNNTYLRLIPGSPLYFEQLIAPKRGERYWLSVAVRGNSKTVLSVSICEKNFLYSFDCVAPTRFEVEPGTSWSERSGTVNMGAIGQAKKPLSWLYSRPVKLSLTAPGPNPVEVDNVRLLDAQGQNLLANSDFSSDIDHWFFSTDDHLAWQIKNHWVHLYFEQGWLGVLAQAVFGLFVITQFIVRIGDGDSMAAVSLAAFVGFLTVGIFGFLFDTPRLALLFYLVTLVGISFVRPTACGTQLNG